MDSRLHLFCHIFITFNWVEMIDFMQAQVYLASGLCLTVKWVVEDRRNYVSICGGLNCLSTYLFGTQCGIYRKMKSSAEQKMPTSEVKSANSRLSGVVPPLAGESGCSLIASVFILFTPLAIASLTMCKEHRTYCSGVGYCVAL